MNQRILAMNRNSEHKLDGIAVLKTILSMFENMAGIIDNALPEIVKMLVDELFYEKAQQKPCKSFISMLIQTLSMSFWYNCQLTF